MWVVEVREQDRPIQEFYFKGPLCELGRNVDLNICLQDDKSISRKHAELHLVPSTDPIRLEPALFVKDLNSKFGTFLNEVRLQPNQLIEIKQDEATIRVGANQTFIRVVRKTLQFCGTRLDKAEKTKLKQYAKSIQAKVINEMETATHLICNKITATVKTLTAIALGVKMIHLDWLQFAETNKSLELIPPLERYPPLADDLKFIDLKLSRSSMFHDLHVLILDKEDLQYATSLQTCGATITKIFEYKDVCQTWEEVNAKLPKLNSKSVKHCIFFDENRGVEADNTLRNVIHLNPLFWITAASLAASILEMKTPELLPEPPSKVRNTAFSQSQVQVYTQSRMFDSQLFGESSQAPLVNAKIFQISPVKQHNLLRAHAIQPVEATTPALPQTSKFLPTFKETVEIDKSKAMETSSVLSKSIVDLFEEEDEVKKPAEVSKSHVEVSSTRATPTSKKKRFLESPVDEPPTSRLKKEDIKPQETAVKAPPEEIQSDIGHDDISFPVLEENPPSVSPKQPKVATSNKSKSSSKVVSTEVVTEPPVKEVKKAVLKPNQTTNKIITKEVALDDDWVSVVHGIKDMDILAEQGENRTSGESEGEIYVKPEVVEKRLIKLEMNNNNYVTSSSSSSSSSSSMSGMRNVKKFSKNFVKSTNSKFSVKQMEKVLPKESEREIQMRLEFEADNARKQAAEFLFSDRFGMQTSKRKM